MKTDTENMWTEIHSAAFYLRNLNFELILKICQIKMTNETCVAILFHLQKPEQSQYKLTCSIEQLIITQWPLHEAFFRDETVIFLSDVDVAWNNCVGFAWAWLILKLLQTGCAAALQCAMNCIMFPPTQCTNKWVIPHTRAKAQVKPLFLSPKLAEVHQKPSNNEKGWICSYDRFIVNIYSFIPVQSWLGPCKNKTAVSKLSSVEPVTYAMRLSWNVAIIPLRLWQGTHRETGRKRWGGRVQSGHQDGESNLQLDFIGSIQTLKTCLERKEENVARKKKPKIWAVRIPKATTKLPVSGTENVRLIWLSVLQQIFRRRNNK